MCADLIGIKPPRKNISPIPCKKNASNPGRLTAAGKGVFKWEMRKTRAERELSRTM